jgi:hypothetical protein
VQLHNLGRRHLRIAHIDALNNRAHLLNVVWWCKDDHRARVGVNPNTHTWKETTEYCCGTLRRDNGKIDYRRLRRRYRLRAARRELGLPISCKQCRDDAKG